MFLCWIFIVFVSRCSCVPMWVPSAGTVRNDGVVMWLLGTVYHPLCKSKPLSEHQLVLFPQLLYPYPTLPFGNTPPCQSDGRYGFVKFWDSVKCGDFGVALARVWGYKPHVWSKNICTRCKVFALPEVPRPCSKLHSALGINQYHGLWGR